MELRLSFGICRTYCRCRPNERTFPVLIRSRAFSLMRPLSCLIGERTVRQKIVYTGLTTAIKLFRVRLRDASTFRAFYLLTIQRRVYYATAFVDHRSRVAI